MTVVGPRLFGADAKPAQIGELTSRRAIDVQSICSLLCCAYVISQIYMVPVLVVGPSWSVWPSLTDLVVLLMLVLLPITRTHSLRRRPAITAAKRALLVVTLSAIVSYLALTLNYFGLKTAELFNDKGQNVGLYQIYRLCQFSRGLLVCHSSKLGQQTQALATTLNRTYVLAFLRSLAG